MVGLLKSQMVIYIKGTSRVFVGTELPEKAKDDAIKIFWEWCNLARLVIRAEFPSFELVYNFCIFDLDDGARFRWRVVLKPYNKSAYLCSMFSFWKFEALKILQLNKMFGFECPPQEHRSPVASNAMKLRCNAWHISSMYHSMPFATISFVCCRWLARNSCTFMAYPMLALGRMQFGTFADGTTRSLWCSAKFCRACWCIRTALVVWSTTSARYDPAIPNHTCCFLYVGGVLGFEKSQYRCSHA